MGEYPKFSRMPLEGLTCVQGGVTCVCPGAGLVLLED